MIHTYAKHSERLLFVRLISSCLFGSGNMKLTRISYETLRNQQDLRIRGRLINFGK